MDGTVLPWYTDPDTKSVADEVARQVTDWHRLSSQYGPLGCVAGDFNVDLGGGPHYYGSRESKDAVCERLREAELELLTGFPLTAPIAPSASSTTSPSAERSHPSTCRRVSGPR